MDIQTRKLEFIQEFLKLQSEEAISRLEKLLLKEKKADIAQDLKPMSEAEFNKRIDQAEADFENGRFKTSGELLSKYSK